MATAALFVPLHAVSSGLIWSSRLLSTSFLLVLYASVLAALFSTARVYGSERSSLAPGRRTPYIAGLAALFALSALPFATWPIALSGVTLHLRVPVFCMLCVNAAAAILIWFGSGWSRLGLTVVAYWICFLWCIPLAMRG